MVYLDNLRVQAPFLDQLEGTELTLGDMYQFVVQAMSYNSHANEEKGEILKNMKIKPISIGME